MLKVEGGFLHLLGKIWDTFAYFLNDLCLIESTLISDKPFNAITLPYL